MTSPSVNHRLNAASLAILLLSVSATAALDVDLAINNLDSPVRVIAPLGDTRLFVVEQEGRIRVFSRGGNDLGVFLSVTGLISTGGERGLLGLAFDPRYDQNGRLYVNYTDDNGDTRVVRYNVDPDNPNRALSGSASQVLFVDQTAPNHNGGHLEFGPDGMLYVGMGDGGGSGDLLGNGQNRQVLLGKMLRLDVSGSQGYTIPADNPFVGSSTRDEIWALGVRNPWCFSFDRLTGDLYIADVGQWTYEEIDVQPASSSGGENYGWRLMEGMHCFNPPSDCNDGSLALPIHEYEHSDPGFPCSISGGYVHRGGGVPALRGRYVFGDYCSNYIWSLDWTASGGVGSVLDHTSALTPPGGYDNVVGIGQDGLGDLYVIDHGGSLWRIVDETVGVNIPDAKTRLLGAAPNPFNPRTELIFVMADAGQARLTMHDLTGRRVATVATDRFEAGEHRLQWDGRDQFGQELPSGPYVVRLVAGDVVSSQKVTLVR